VRVRAVEMPVCVAVGVGKEENGIAVTTGALRV
jgi:hypothetical protein